MTLALNGIDKGFEWKVRVLLTRCAKPLLMLILLPDDNVVVNVVCLMVPGGD